MERTYGSLVRHELGSSYSALDGVPFKIGRAFRAPEQVKAPQLLKTTAAGVSSEQYTFEVEEAVLTWAKARDEAVQKAVEEQTQRTKQNEKLTAEATESQATSLQNEDSLSSNADPEEISVYDVPRYSVPQKRADDNQVKPPVPPKASSLLTNPISGTDTVLTPIPIKPFIPLSGDKKLSLSADSNGKINSQLDLAMFEAEVDPFDNLELQTLNDMEELKVLLNSSSVNVNCDPSNVEELITEKPEVVESFDNSESSASQARSNQHDTEFHMEDDLSKGSCERTSQLNETSLKTLDDGEYVEITPKYKNQSEFPLNMKENCTFSNGVAFHKPFPTVDGLVSVANMNSHIYKPVLPPIAKSAHFKESSTCLPVTDPQPYSSPDHPASPELWSSSSQSLAESGACQPIKENNDSEIVSASPPLAINPIKPSRPAPPPPVSTKPVPVPRTKAPFQSSDGMSSSTGPSLAMFLGNTGQPVEHRTPSPYSRHCNSTSDLILAASSNGSDCPRRNSAAVSPQPWNRHVPLPPPPSSNPNKPSFRPPSQPIGLSDPYSSLSREEQNFTDILTNMGFLRPRVARAVKKFGTQEKEVLDHLLAVDKLGEQSYAPLMVESALFTFKNDLEKASRFLQLHAQFEELGFQRDKIHDALVSTDLEHDKALDILTA